MINRLKKYASFYHIAHTERVKMYHLKWRVFFILLVASAMIFIKEYLESRYPLTVFDAVKNVSFPLYDRLFSWFGIGVLFGVAAVSLMHEGEFMLNLRSFVHGIEEQTQGMLKLGKGTGRNKKTQPANKSLIRKHK